MKHPIKKSAGDTSISPADCCFFQLRELIILQNVFHIVEGNAVSASCITAEGLAA